MAEKDREPVQLWSNQLPTISQRTTMDFFARRTVGQSDRLKTLKYRTLWNFGGRDRQDRRYSRTLPTSNNYNTNIYSTWMFVNKLLCLALVLFKQTNCIDWISSGNSVTCYLLSFLSCKYTSLLVDRKLLNIKRDRNNWNGLIVLNGWSQGLGYNMWLSPLVVFLPAMSWLPDIRTWGQKLEDLSHRRPHLVPSCFGITRENKTIGT